MRGLVAVVLIVVCADRPEAAAQQGWYVEVGAGLGMESEFKHEGQNLDVLCYPTNPDCPSHTGYHWHYDITAESGSAIHIAVGRRVNRWRFDVTAAQDVRNIEQMFSSITYLGGQAIPPRLDNGVIEMTGAGVGSLYRRSARFNAFYDLVSSNRRLVPYVGGGVGLSQLTATDVYFSNQFSCAPDATCTSSLEFYNILQNADNEAVRLSALGYAGVDYQLTPQVTFGLRFALSHTGELEDNSTYTIHPLPDLTNTAVFGPFWLHDLVASVRYEFRR